MAASGDAEPEHGDTIAEPVAALAAAQNRERELCEAAAAFGGRLELLADGSLVVTLAHVGVPSEQAAWAARCALALRALLPEHPMALALEDRTASGALGLGAAIERGVQTLMVETFDKIFADGQDGSDGQGAIRLDDRTVELLTDRFDVVRGAQGSYLRGEKLGMP